MSTANTNSLHPTPPTKINPFCKIPLLAAAMATFITLVGLPAFAATITVDAATDAGGAGNCTLRQAIEAANTNATVDNCAAGTAADTIIFAAGLNNQTITLNGNQINIDDTAALTIDASALADGVIISGNNVSRIFGVTQDQPLTLNNLTLTAGRTTAATTTFDLDCAINTFTRGGAICAEGALTLIDSTVSGNSTAGSEAGGGGFYAIREATLNNSTVFGNSTAGFFAGGGGFRADGATTLNNSTVSGNSTAEFFAQGGGFRAFGEATLNNSTVSGNSTVGSDASGGGFRADGATTLNNSTVSGNSTTGTNASGGGFRAFGGASLSNSTVSGNSTAGAGAFGGGFRARSVATLNNSTISQNTASHATATGGGVFLRADFASTLTLNSTILSGNGSDNFAFSGIGSATVNATHSLFGDDEEEITDTNTDNEFSNLPRLIGLADNGCAVTTPAGCVNTHEPAAGSLAIDNGATNGQILDQRGTGFARPLGGTQADIGAFETIPVVIPPINPFGECDGVAGINTQDVTCTINKVLNP